MKSLLLALAVGLALSAQLIRADDPALPVAPFAPARYEPLWTNSPFAVATSETSQETSPDYVLVGIAKIDGISYGSLIEVQNQEHFLISTDKPTRGLTLTSITHSQDGSDTFAVVQKDGQAITLKLQQAPALTPGLGAPGINAPAPGMTPQIPMPGAGASVGNPASVRPFPRFHRPAIHLPPPTAPPPQSPMPVQPATVPPPPPSQ